MTDKQHTPGPWKAFELHNNDRTSRMWFLHRENGDIATVLLHTKNDTDIELMRSAPEMADKLERLRSMLSRYVDTMVGAARGVAREGMAIIEEESDGD